MNSHHEADNEAAKRRLGEAVKRRRESFGWSRSEMHHKEGGPHPDTIRNVEDGGGVTKAPTWRALDLSLRWPIGTCQAIYRGGRAPAEDPRWPDRIIVISIPDRIPPEQRAVAEHAVQVASENVFKALLGDT